MRHVVNIGGGLSSTMELWRRRRYAMAKHLDSIHCDRIKCDRIATKRVRAEGMVTLGMRGTLCCDVHAEMLIEDGRKHGHEWVVEAFTPRKA